MMFSARTVAVAILSSLVGTCFAGSRTTAPSGAITVAKSGGDYTTLSAAIASLSTSTTSTQSIFIEAGTYDEQVYIPALKGWLEIYGYTTNTDSYTSNAVTISHSASLKSESTDDETATVRNWSTLTRFYNINIANTYGEGSQALALSAYGTYQGYYGCQFTGYQDTLLAQTGYQIYANCLIEGAIDFIFGQHASAWFNQVDIRVLAGPSEGTITANGRTSSSDISYYVINDSTVAAASGNSVTAGTYYLGRPWTEYARVVFQSTSMTSVINSAGWVEWSSSSPNTADVLFGEYDNSGAGSEGTRASFATKLSAAISIGTILGSDYTDWVDTTYL